VVTVTENEIRGLLMLIEFSDYGTTIVSKPNLYSIRGRSI